MWCRPWHADPAEVAKSVWRAVPFLVPLIRAQKNPQTVKSEGVVKGGEPVWATIPSAVSWASFRGSTNTYCLLRNPNTMNT